MPVYDGINGVVRKRKEWPVGINGVVRQQKEHWAGIDGVKRQIFSAGTPVGNLAVGGVVQLNENGVAQDYLCVHQGLPSSLYDSSCDGTWLLRKDIYENRQWNSSNRNDYENSTIDNYLNKIFLNLFESNIRNAIKQVKIPYRKGAGYGNTVTSGARGLSTKIFLLSATEVGFNVEYMPTNEGACLSYFSGTSPDSSDDKRVAYLNGSATVWWLRSPFCYSVNGSTYALGVFGNGNWSNGGCSGSFGIRPALVLPSNFLI